MVVDVHAHYYPEEYLKRLGRPQLAAVSAAGLAGQGIEERLALLDRTGVGCQVLSVSQAQPYLPVASDAAAAAALANDLYTELCRAHPGRFFSFAALPLPHVEESLAEIERSFASDAVVGVTVGCSVAGIQLDDPILAPVFEELDKREAVVFLHPVGHEETPWLAGYSLAWMVGAPFEDTAAALRLVLGGVLERCQRIRFIVPHLGGTIPFLLSRLDRQGGGHLSRDLARFYYDTVSGSVDALTCSCHSFGTQRLLFGTDYPYCNEEQFGRHLSYLDEAGLSPSELRSIREETATTLLGLEGRVAPLRI